MLKQTVLFKRVRRNSVSEQRVCVLSSHPTFNYIQSNSVKTSQKVLNIPCRYKWVML